MNILGISCFYHDSAAAIISNGNIVAAAQEERFTRKKHDASFPLNAIESCLKKANLNKSDIDIVAFYDKPFLKFERILETYLGYVPIGIQSAWKSIPLWIKEKLWISEEIGDCFDKETTLIYPEHHESHAASAFFPSPFDCAAILTIDGVGEWATSSIGLGEGNRIRIDKELHFPHSLGLLYSAFTYYTGFKVNSGEYKLMGLAPYGEPIFADKIMTELIDLRQDGSFRMNMDYFGYSAGLKMTNRKFDQLFGGSPRKPESKFTQREMDLAASIQVVAEKIVEKMALYACDLYQTETICMAGGVALNCVANGKLSRNERIKNIWIQPAAGDAGGAIGAAYMAWYHYLGKERSIEPDDSMKGSYLGPDFSNDVISDFIEENHYKAVELSDNDLYQKAADLLDKGNVIGWFQGAMEFGPRALGNRSIIGDPRNREMQKTLNLKIKYRESFRPFAPSILEEKAEDYFQLEGHISPYMLLVTDINSHIKHAVNEEVKGFDKLYQIRSELPAITHVDNSARVQTVSKNRNSRYHSLISAFYERTGCPVLINTSFNVRGEPIVCTPDDAYRCFMRTEMDYLVLGNFILDKKDQSEWTETKQNWQTEFELD